MKVTDLEFYDGAKPRIGRLGLTPLIDEVKQVLERCRVLLLEKKHGNGGAVIRKMLDKGFESRTGWKKISSGGVDWVKCKAVNGTSVCVGVEIQVSARSDLVIRDIIHLRNSLTLGVIDVGILVVPGAKLSLYLVDRAPTLRETKRVIEEDARVTDLPLLLMAVEHDGVGPALPKQKRRS